MKTLERSLIMAVFVLLFVVSNVFAQTTRSQLQQMYFDYLREQGYQPEIDRDGDIRFRVEGHHFFIVVDEDDLESFRICFPNFWAIESEEERVKVSAAIMYVNSTTKVAKVYIESWDNTWIDSNIYISQPEDFKNHFSRMVDVILYARRKFTDKMWE